MSDNLDRHQDRSTLSVRMTPEQADACRVVAKSSGLPSLNAVLIAACQPRELSAGEAKAVLDKAIRAKSLRPVTGQSRRQWEGGDE